MKREDGRVHLKDFVPGGNLDAYLQKMLQQGEWADHIIVMCMAAYLQRDIIVITSSPNTNPDDNILWISSGNAAGDPLSFRTYMGEPISVSASNCHLFLFRFHI